MSEALDSYDKVLAYALTLPDTEPGSVYGKPTAMLPNGRGFVFVGHEPQTSFVAWVDAGLRDILMETEPETYWQSRHYNGTTAILVRFDSADPDRVRHVIRHAHDHVAAQKPPRPRKPKR
jgi:hypothetical protein